MFTSQQGPIMGLETLQHPYAGAGQGVHRAEPAGSWVEKIEPSNRSTDNMLGDDIVHTDTFDSCASPEVPPYQYQWITGSTIHKQFTIFYEI